MVRSVLGRNSKFNHVVLESFGRRRTVGWTLISTANGCVVVHVAILGVVNGGEMGRDGSLRLVLVASRPTIRVSTSTRHVGRSWMLFGFVVTVSVLGCSIDGQMSRLMDLPINHMINQTRIVQS